MCKREPRPISVGVDCVDLVEGHLVRIKELRLWDWGIKVEFEIWPSVPIAEAFDHHALRFWGSVKAEDDHGTIYYYGGGGYGPLGDESGRFGSGHFWLHGPPLQAQDLRITIEPIADSGPIRPCGFVVRLDTGS